MSSASAPTPKAITVFVCCVLLLLDVGLPPTAAGVTKCSDYCRAKCSLDRKDRSVVSVCGSTICRAGVLGACLGACYGICTDDCI